VVHLAGRFEPEEGRTLGTVHGGGTRNVLAEARKSGVRRFVLVSALGASPGGTEFYRTKFEAEDAVLASGLEHVVLRPAVVYGPGDHFTSAIVRILRAFPVFPMLGDGTFRLQPVAVEDVCDALAQSVERPDVVRRTLALAGPEALSFVRIVRIVGETIGRPRAIVPLPEALAAPSSSVAGRLGLPSPIARSQLDLLAGGCVLEPGEPNPLRSVFAVKPLPFADAVADYLGPA
jgi:NADH dehydrogenase